MYKEIKKVIFIFEVDDLKRKYNHLVGRLKKADEFFHTCKDKEKIEKQMPNLKKILDESQRILNELTALGVEFTSDDVLEGFDIEDRL